MQGHQEGVEITTGRLVKHLPFRFDVGMNYFSHLSGKQFIRVECAFLWPLFIFLTWNLYRSN